MESDTIHRHRADQLRRAKRAQRTRDAAAGLVLCQVKLRPPTAAKLRDALSLPGAEEALAAFLDDLIIDAREFPGLRDLLWNRDSTRVTAREAFDLYERNWRFLEPATLSVIERALIDRLALRFGGGLLNVAEG
jgi:hypothetical protein